MTHDQPLDANYLIKRIVCGREDIREDCGLSSIFAVTRAFAAAVITNPWLPSTSKLAELAPAVQAICPDLAITLSGYLISLLAGVERIESYGKGALVGVDGELEHSAALLHTPYFGNVMRERLGGTEFIAFSDVRCAKNMSLVVPMEHKTAGGRRSHFFTMPVLVPDAPEPDEIVVVIVAATGPRPNARIGDRTTDLPFTLAQHTSQRSVRRAGNDLW